MKEGQMENISFKLTFNNSCVNQNANVHYFHIMIYITNARYTTIIFHFKLKRLLLN
jgi:hypothetical protein